MIKRYVGIVLLALLLSFIPPSQMAASGEDNNTGKSASFPNASRNEAWNTTFGGSNIDVGYSVYQTSDEGYIITGYTRSYGAMSGHNVWLIKTDSLGDEEWNRTFGGNGDDEGWSVQQTADGGYIVAGWTTSFGAGADDMYLIKTDNSGNQQWSKTFGGTADDAGYSVLQTSDGGYLVAGCTFSFGAGSGDVWLIKTDGSGNEQWRKTLGGYSSDGARSIQQTTDGGYIIAGWTWSYGSGLNDVWLVKTDNLGNQQWHKAFGGTDSDSGYSVQQTADGGYIITGETDSFGAGLYDMFLIKTNTSGNEQWKKTYGGTGRDYGRSVQQATDEGYIIVGYTLSYGSGNEDVWVVETDALGNKLNSTAYGGAASDVGYSLQKTADGGYIITGHTLSYGAGVHDVWLIKIAGNISEITITIGMSPGWNLITVPLDTVWTAESLGDNISGCSVVLMFNATTQTFLTHVVGTPWDDFPIQDGVGYFIYVTSGSSLEVTGPPITGVIVHISVGWNIIGWYKETGTTAESLGDNITGCSTVLKFDAPTQTFLTHVVNTPWDNFAVTRGMGLFLYTTSASDWHGEG